MLIEVIVSSGSLMEAKTIGDAPLILIRERGLILQTRETPLEEKQQKKEEKKRKAMVSQLQPVAEATLATCIL